MNVSSSYSGYYYYDDSISSLPNGLCTATPIMFLTVAVSVKLANYNGSPVIYDQATVGHVVSVATSVLLDLSYFASLFLVTLVSLERFYAVCHPVQHRLIRGMKRTTKL